MSAPTLAPLDELFVPALPPQSPPPGWAEAISTLAVEQDLPPLLQPAAEAPLVEGRWQLHPYRLRGDVGAVLQWAAQLPLPVAIWRVTTRDGAVEIHGDLAGQPVALVADSHRLPAEARDHVDLAVLREIERAEQDAARAELDDLVLLDEQRADPLGEPAARPSPSPRTRPTAEEYTP